jgi:acetamidase/formamidase
VIHEIPLERRTLHGHFSPDLEAVLRIEPGDSVRFSTIDAGWGMEGGATPGGRDRPRFEPRERGLDDGHALVGPIEVAGAKAGQALSVRIDELRVGTYGVTDAGGWSSWLNDRLGVTGGETATLWWELDAEAGIGRDQHGQEVDLRPFLGVIGMPPPVSEIVHSTTPPRRWGGNLDCSELVAGATLFLPIPVDGALLSLGDGHARQGDGEVCGTAIECSMVSAQVTVDLNPDLDLRAPLVRTANAWIALGFDEDLDDALAQATESILDLIERDHGVGRKEALALASVAVDFRVTQVVNAVKGVHAVLRDDAIRFRDNPI